MPPRDRSPPSRLTCSSDARARATAVTVLAGCLAVLAFVLAGTTLGSTLPDSQPQVTTEGGETYNRSGSPIRGTAGGQRGPEGEGGADATCSLLCPGTLLTATAREVVAGVGLLAMLGALVVAYRLTGGAADVEFETSEREDGVGLDAPDGSNTTSRRSLDEPVTNEVYRAWNDFRERLAPRVDDPDTTTPGEYERLARRVGFDAGAVATLTDLFRRVRYRREEPTVEHERQASDALAALPADPPSKEEPTGHTSATGSGSEDSPTASDTSDGGGIDSDTTDDEAVGSDTPGGDSEEAPR